MLRELTDDDLEQSWALSRLAFGGDRSATPVQHEPPAGVTRAAYGAFEDGRLLAQVAVRRDAQWWGGRVVPMLGVAGVAAHPDARGRGLVGQLLDLMSAQAGEPLSVLYATAPGIYRRQGWEIVGTLDVTPVPLRLLPSAIGSVRAFAITDADAVARLYDARGAATNGLLARVAARTAATVARHDVATVAVQDGVVVGYVAYQRERGYRGDGQLHLQECLAATPAALAALMGSLRSWEAVVDSVHWRGSVTDLELAVPGLVPVPAERQPWSLRVLDPVAGVAARGFAPGTWALPLMIDGTPYRLEVASGRGELVVAQGDGPVLTPQGLALLFAGRGDLVHRHGHSDRPVAELAVAFSGPPPEILDYF